MSGNAYFLTVFTPTYNRKNTLIRTYNSLCNQTFKEFLWMIIDDGSIDGTGELVEKWKLEGRVNIEYYFKKNGGMHTAHNLAYDLIKSELSVCIDSDDLMPVNAVEIIYDHWCKLGSDKFSGIIALNATLSGSLIGSLLPESIVSSTLTDLVRYHKVSGDKKMIYRTSVMKELPRYPEFENEKLVPLSYKYWLADLNYELLILNKVVCNVEYLVGGSSNTIFKQYFQSPRGFAVARKSMMKYSPRIKERFIAATHYVSSSIISKNYNFLSESPRKLLTVLAIVPGILWTLYCKRRARV